MVTPPEFLVIYINYGTILNDLKSDAWITPYLSLVESCGLPLNLQKGLLISKSPSHPKEFKPWGRQGAGLDHDLANSY